MTTISDDESGEAAAAAAVEREREIEEIEEREKSLGIGFIFLGWIEIGKKGKQGEGDDGREWEET